MGLRVFRPRRSRGAICNRRITATGRGCENIASSSAAEYALRAPAKAAAKAKSEAPEAEAEADLLEPRLSVP